MNKDIRLTESGLFIVMMVNKMLDFISTNDTRFKLKDIRIKPVDNNPDFDRAHVKLYFRTKGMKRILEWETEIKITKVTFNWHLEHAPIVLRLLGEGVRPPNLNLQVKDDKFECYEKELLTFREKIIT